MNKKLLIILLSIMAAVAIFFVLISSGVIQLDTFSQNKEIKNEISRVEDMSASCYYVWHNPDSNDISIDLEGATEDAAIKKNVFFLCPTGTINWSKDSFINHTVWFTSDEDVTIPTLYPGDKLLYNSPISIPYQGINWERFADYGYTIGVANMIGDESGHYRISNENGDGYKGYLCPISDTYELNKYTNVSSLFLDTIGGVPIRDNSITKGGTVLNLTKDKSYVCVWYTGSYYQKYKLQANIHTFSTMESFTTYDYEFLQSRCIEITIPDWLKTGYYYVDGIGMFRYVAQVDAGFYNGKPYDSGIDWNDPIIIYNDNGDLIYNPATGVDKRMESQEMKHSAVANIRENPTQESNVNTESNYGYNDADYYYDDGTGDVGVDEFEDIVNEVVIE